MNAPNSAPATDTLFMDAVLPLCQLEGPELCSELGGGREAQTLTLGSLIWEACAVLTELLPDVQGRALQLQLLPGEDGPLYLTDGEDLTPLPVERIWQALLYGEETLDARGPAVQTLDADAGALLELALPLAETWIATHRRGAQNDGDNGLAALLRSSLQGMPFRGRLNAVLHATWAAR